MIRIKADYIFPVSSSPIEQGILVVDNLTGKIIDLINNSKNQEKYDQYYSGVLVPGFVNAHCHLELSHMKGIVPTGTKLIPFISDIVTKRGATKQQIRRAIQRADNEMYRNGIVAVGDISNTSDSFLQKSKSKIHYHTFIEMFDFLQDAKALENFDHYIKAYNGLNTKGIDKKSVVPHAPYSVSKSLFEKINAQNKPYDITVSIHNQETQPEIDLFKNKSGDIIPFYNNFGISLDNFQANGTNSIDYALMNMDASKRTIFVHNTLTTEENIQSAQQKFEQLYWATCPNANLYIENNLPRYQHFINQNAKICIGTDSLSSNWGLSILEEMKTISKYQSNIDFPTLLKWATLNGAEALGMEATIGSFEVGKIPGVNVIDINSKNMELSNKTKIRKIL